MYCLSNPFWKDHTASLVAAPKALTPTGMDICATIVTMESGKQHAYQILECSSGGLYSKDPANPTRLVFIDSPDESLCVVVRSLEDYENYFFSKLHVGTLVLSSSHLTLLNTRTGIDLVEKILRATLFPPRVPFCLADRMVATKDQLLSGSMLAYDKFARYFRKFRVVSCVDPLGGGVGATVVSGENVFQLIVAKDDLDDNWHLFDCFETEDTICCQEVSETVGTPGRFLGELRGAVFPGNCPALREACMGIAATMIIRYGIVVRLPFVAHGWGPAFRVNTVEEEHAAELAAAEERHHKAMADQIVVVNELSAAVKCYEKDLAGQITVNNELTAELGCYKNDLAIHIAECTTLTATVKELKEKLSDANVHVSILSTCSDAQLAKIKALEEKLASTEASLTEAGADLEKEVALRDEIEQARRDVSTRYRAAVVAKEAAEKKFEALMAELATLETAM